MYDSRNNLSHVFTFTFLNTCGVPWKSVCENIATVGTPASSGSSGFVGYFAIGVPVGSLAAPTSCTIGATAAAFAATLHRLTGAAPAATALELLPPTTATTAGTLVGAGAGAAATTGLAIDGFRIIKLGCGTATIGIVT
ncbi:hypothetical protein AYI69_g5057 [Smittium culicis]|uniref:Uncharacterized protein n=1 Tax=Smittium culicis TaxID=133412 RepID=A0A1R1Y8L5_9FUNG|nr:hypothetical protein AYI69_g5057 [Smittium culicis]